jgi:hypothetical protein
VTKWVSVLVAAALLAPSAASAQSQEPLATAVLYEVNEALRFVKSGDRDREVMREKSVRGKRANTSDVARRLAKASLLGREVRPLVDGDIFKAGSFVQAEATSNVDLVVGKGPLHGKLKLLTDADPTRESLDTLVVDTEAFIRGELDLTTAMQGFAGMSGRWSAPKHLFGTFQGLFLIPFQVEGDDRYFYLDIAGPADPCEAPEYAKVGDQTLPVCPLQSFEFALGIPLTKAVVTFFD